MQRKHNMKVTVIVLAGMLTAVACGAPYGHAPTVSSSVSGVAFGTVELGASASRTVTLANDSGAPVTVTDVVVDGADVSASGPALPFTLAPGESADVALRFTPVSSGYFSGSLAVRDGTQDLLVTSYGAKAVRPASPLSFAPGVVDFGTVNVGGSATFAVTVTNTSSTTQTVGGITTTDSEVTASGLALPAAFAPGASRTFQIVYDPAAAGAVKGHLALRGYSGTTPLAVLEFLGSGVSATAVVSATPSQLDFGQVTVGAFSAQGVTLSNVGPDPVTLSTVVATGAGFSASGLALPLSLAAGQSATLGVRFAPVAGGAASGTVSFYAQGQAAPVASVACAGSGVVAPSISSVTVRAATVEASKSVQLVADVVASGSIDTSVTWSVQAGSLGTVDPASGLYTAPSTPGSYTVVARSVADPTKAAAATVTVTAPTAPSPFANVTVAPPAMTSPIVITLPGSYLRTVTQSTCSGPAYVVSLDDTKDYIIQSTEILHAPVQINGGRNVRIVGLELELDTTVCAGGFSGYVPATIALLFQQVGTTFVEGAYIDLHGKAADCMVARNRIGGGEALSKGYTETAARGARDVVIQNSVCRGYAGDTAVHGDLLQTQGLHELYRSIVFENVSVDSLCEGTMLLPRDGYHLADQITIRNLDYRWDTRYPRNLTGIPVLDSAKAYSYSSVYSTIASVDQYYAPLSGQHRAVPQDGSVGVYISATPAARFAIPAGGAADAWTGIQYVSPHPMP